MSGDEGDSVVTRWFDAGETALAVLSDSVESYRAGAELDDGELLLRVQRGLADADCRELVMVITWLGRLAAQGVLEGVEGDVCLAKERVLDTRFSVLFARAEVEQGASEAG